jgi:hypothetical protein
VLCVYLQTGDMQSVHYDKRGAKITIAYDGDDCAGKKDEVEQAANKFCTESTAVGLVCFLPFACPAPHVAAFLHALLFCSVARDGSSFPRTIARLSHMLLRALLWSVLSTDAHVTGSSH